MNKTTKPVVRQGDFTALAKDYIHRTGYSSSVLTALSRYVGAGGKGFVTADVGAGTGKLTENLIELGLSGFAVEPNDAMRAEGMKLCSHPRGFRWSKGSAESTGLPDRSVDWLLMASSFHWTKREDALREFRRALRPGGYFTALWNPRDLAASELHSRIEARIKEIVPNLQRVSSGGSKYTEWIEQALLSGGLYEDLIFMEAPHQVAMTPERYLGAWRSVNDIQAQAGEENFKKVMTAIEDEVASLDKVVVPYKTRAWTVRVKS